MTKEREPKLGQLVRRRRRLPANPVDVFYISRVQTSRMLRTLVQEAREADAEPQISSSRHNKQTRNLKIELFHSLCITL